MRRFLPAVWIWLTVAGFSCLPILDHAFPQSVSVSAPTQQGPGVDFNFAAGQYYQAGQNCSTIASCITVSRASTGYIDDTSGTWTSFGNNVARISDRGLLVEEARTNSIRNSTMVGAVAGSPGTAPTNWTINTPTGLTRTITLGTSFGVDYIRFNFAGTTSSTATINVVFEAAGAIVAAQNQTWTESAFLMLPQSDAAVTSIQGVIFTSAGETDNSANVISSLSAANWFRNSHARTLASASTADVRSSVVTNSISSGTTINFTIQIGWPQLELGPFATSPIRTTSAAATRAADVVTLTNVPVFGGAYTLYAAGTPNAPNNYGTAQSIIGANDAGVTNRIDARRNNGTATVSSQIVAGGVLTGAPGVPGPWNQNTSGKIGFAVSAGSNNFNFSQTSSGDDTTSPISSGMTILTIGSRSSGALPFNGYISRIALWPTTRLPNAQLQNITGANWQ